ncbi:uncharacterized protein LOC111779884 [Cucurbita pepo subsp. pepo]|uniref:uncharacterized protein LOC111779884 n=1 Tax=Cucurbita pepo subsp. pepo TaxID=3664 RepID=UPI000C9D7457|nr:uncharacterized protein LOC111779884 [Cucurbita pepo subsp. pepo]XP_023515838.1 uncharacterized protein LOC111779884 [Cucurbita pepo subsp. pepo]
MARILSQSQSFISSKMQSAPLKLLLLIPSSFVLGHRNRSTRSGKAKFIEIDLESSSFGADSEVLAIRKLDDFVERIIVERSTPDWVPFVPGSSFWVPPRRTKPRKVVDLFDKFVEPLSKEVSPSLANSRGWPCLDFFAKGSISGATRLAPLDTEFDTSNEVELEIEVKTSTITDNSNQPED